MILSDFSLTHLHSRVPQPEKDKKDKKKKESLRSIPVGQSRPSPQEALTLADALLSEPEGALAPSPPRWTRGTLAHALLAHSLTLTRKLRPQIHRWARGGRTLARTTLSYGGRGLTHRSALGPHVLLLRPHHQRFAGQSVQTPHLGLHDLGQSSEPASC